MPREQNSRPIPTALNLGGAGPDLTGALTVRPAPTVDGFSDGVDLVWTGSDRRKAVTLRLNAAQTEALAASLVGTRGQFADSAGEAPTPAPTKLAEGGLTEREVQLLRLVSRGLTNRQIAEQTGLADATVKTYLHNAMSRLGAQTRTRAVIIAQRRNLI